MLDAALIEKCADPSLNPAIVVQFIDAAGSTDPLTITVKSGGRLILVPRPRTNHEAMDIIRQHVGSAVVRVGLTQLPAGIGVKDATELKPDLVDPCENLRIGTRMFAKILRIVAKWYGNSINAEIFPRVFEDAVYAWKSGEFEGTSVFQAEEPGKSVTVNNTLPAEDDEGKSGVDGADAHAQSVDREESIGSAEMRIDLSRIGGK